MNSIALYLLPLSMLMFEDKSSYPEINPTALQKFYLEKNNLNPEHPAEKVLLLRATKQPLKNWHDMIKYSDSSIVKIFSKEIEYYAQHITTDYDIQTYLLNELAQHKK